MVKNYYVIPIGATEKIFQLQSRPARNVDTRPHETSSWHMSLAVARVIDDTRLPFPRLSPWRGSYRAADRCENIPPPTLPPKKLPASAIPSRPPRPSISPEQSSLGRVYEQSAFGLCLLFLLRDNTIYDAGRTWAVVATSVCGDTWRRYAATGPTANLDATLHLFTLDYAAYDIITHT